MTSTIRMALDVLARPERHRYGPQTVQSADLYLPPGAGPHPVAVVIHGGSWRATYGKAVMKPVCADLARRGIAAWNIEYRRLGRGQGGGYPETFDDVAAAIDLLPSVAGGRVDLGNVALLGHSAGGQLALWAAARQNGGLAVRRVVAQAPVTDMRATEIARALLGGTPDQVPERYSAVDPMQHVPLAVPVRIVHGADDATIPLFRSRRYVEAAAAAGGSVELIEPVPGNHRAHIDPRSVAWQAAAEFLENGRSAP